MTERNRIARKIGRSAGLAAMMLAPALVWGPRAANADDTVTLSLTLKDHKFDPAEVHAPAGKPIAIHVKNLNTIVSEFESSDLHFEKIVPVGTEAVVFVRPQQPGRYNFYDDFHHETQGYLVVP
jgi:hypothetical protein